MKRIVVIPGVILAVVAAAIATAPAALAQVRTGGGGPGWTALFGGGSEIGASVRDVQQAEAERQKIRGGAAIEDVRSGSAAEKAGLKKGDIVVEFDGEHVRSARQLTRLVQETSPGKSVKATVVRDGRRTDVSLVASERSAEMPIDERLRIQLPRLRDLPSFDFGLPGSTRRLGVTVQELTPQLAGYFGANDGVLVSSVADDSPASRAGLKAGDVIATVDGRAVVSGNELVRALRDARSDEEITIGIIRDKKESSLKAKLEERSPARRRAARTLRSA